MPVQGEAAAARLLPRTPTCSMPSNRQEDHRMTPAFGPLHCREHILPVHERVLLMGILNVTPDSFSDGGVYIEVSAAVQQAMTMIEEGADLIDIGAESTRPGADPVDAAEEWRRLRPVLDAVCRRATVP